MLLPFSFVALNLSIYQSLYLSTYQQSTYQFVYKVICPSDLKAVLSTETVLFIKIGYHEIQIQTSLLGVHVL